MYWYSRRQRCRPIRSRGDATSFLLNLRSLRQCPAGGFSVLRTFARDLRQPAATLLDHQSRRVSGRDPTRSPLQPIYGCVGTIPKEFSRRRAEPIPSSVFDCWGTSLTDAGRSSAAWPWLTASVCRCSSCDKETITVSTSVATDDRKPQSSRAPGTSVAAASVASQSLAMAGANAVAVSSSRFLISSISPPTRSRSSRCFYSARRVSNSAI